MFDDLEALFHEYTLTAYNAFIESIDSNTAGRSNDVRLAMNAATALYHLREHFPGTPKREQLAKVCPDYNLLGDIVDVGKHKRLRNRNRQITSADAIEEVIVLTEYKDEQGVYRDARKAVSVYPASGGVRDVRQILTSVLNMWIDEFQKIGLLKSLSRVHPKAHVIPARKSANGAAPITLGATQGLRFAARYRFERYNYSSGQIEPIDVTNHNFEFVVFEPRRLFVEVTVTQKKTGQKLKRKVELSLSEREQFTQLATHDERRSFLEAIARTHAAKALSESD